MNSANGDHFTQPSTSRRSNARKLKVCHIAATTEGASWMIQQLSGLRDVHGFEVAAVISGEQGSLPDALRVANIPFHVVNFNARAGAPGAMLTMPLTIMRLARILRRERFDIVQTHIFKSMVVGRPAAWIANVPVRLAMIAGPFHLEAPSTRFIERLTYWMDTQLIPASQRSRDLLLQLGIAEPRIAPTIYYAPDEKVFDVNRVPLAHLREEFGWPAQTPVISHVAYFYPRMPHGKWIPENVQGRGLKGHEELVRAAAIVIREFPDAKFVLVGRALDEAGHRYLSEVKALVRNLNLESSVIFAGFRDNPNQILRDADISVQPSLNENCGGALEALLMESPMVASRVGGLVDPIKDNETGILVRPGDPEDLARGILEMLRDPTRAKALGRAGRQLMLQKFTLSHTINELAELYERLSNDAQSRSRYNLLTSVLRMVISAPVFALLAFRIILLDICLPSYSRLLLAKVTSLTGHAGRFAKRIFRRSSLTALAEPKPGP